MLPQKISKNKIKLLEIQFPAFWTLKLLGLWWRLLFIIKRNNFFYFHHTKKNAMVAQNRLEGSPHTSLQWCWNWSFSLAACKQIISVWVSSLASFTIARVKTVNRLVKWISKPWANKVFHSLIDGPLCGSWLTKNCEDDKVLSTTSDCIVVVTGEISSLEWSVFVWCN